MGVEVSECLWWFPSSDGFLGGIALVVGIFLVLVLVLLVVLWCSNVSAVTVSLGGVCLVCADSVFKLALTKEGAKGEKAKVDQCCSTFRLQGLWPIYTATWLYESKVYYWCLGGSVIYSSVRTTVYQFFVIIAIEFKENNAIFEFYEENAVYSIFQNIFWMKIE